MRYVNMLNHLNRVAKTHCLCFIFLPRDSFIILTIRENYLTINIYITIRTTLTIKIALVFNT